MAPFFSPPHHFGLLFESEPVGEAGEEARRLGLSDPALTTRALLLIFSGQLQLDGHQHPARAVRPSSSPHLLCLSDYSSLLRRLGPGRRLTHGLEQPAGEPAPAPPRILFLILARLLLLLFRGGRLHLGGFGGRHGAL